jgi:hypothetical protein
VVLYADFTGGIDITIGAAEMMGVKVTENFHRPFYATHIADYWRRWHITMGTWFKDYLFYPMSVCKPMLRFSKFARSKCGEAVGKRLPVYISMMTLWFLTGLWHDATWNYVVWGLVNGVVLVISQELQPLYNRFHRNCAWADSKAYTAFQIVRTFLLMSMIRSIDRYDGIDTAFRSIVSVFTEFNLPVFLQEGLSGLGLPAAGYIGAGIGLAVTFWVSFLQRKGTDVREILARKNFTVRCAAVFAIIFLIVILGAYGPGYDARQFMYNQF